MPETTEAIARTAENNARILELSRSSRAALETNIDSEQDGRQRKRP